jgi:hypothetical protein
MPTRIDTQSGVPENDLQQLIRDYKEFDQVNIVTAVNDGNHTFTVEATKFDTAPPAAGGSSIVIDGKMSTFGGPDDHGVKPEEGLALFDDADVAANADLFLPDQPAGTSGLAKRLKPNTNYLACRWDYAVTPKNFLKGIKVKVSKAEGAPSIEARPVDWGPNIDTGRVADLSPGLATALGLNTNNTCHVEIPLPANAQTPAPGAGVATGVNMAVIDSSIFPSDMARQLVVMTTFDDATYWVINQIGPQEAGQSLLRRKGNANEILFSDSTVFPVRPSDKIPETVAAELNKAAPQLAPSAGGQVGSPPASDDEASAKMFAQAQTFVGHDTSQAPGTDGGNLACAWSVNEIARLALGKPISTDGGGNGLSTVGLFGVLQARHTRLASASDAKPGTIIIAPTRGENHGHVGVVGRASDGVNGALVYSNSSSAKKFAQNYTIGSFTNRYVTKKGLQVLFFALKKDQFG